MKLVTVMPTRGLIFARTIESLRREGAANLLTIENLPIPDCANEAIRRALTYGHVECDYILMVEDDMELPLGALPAMLEVDKPVVAINYAVAGGHPTVYTVKDKVVQVGLGCTLFKRWVFEKLSDPWFEADRSINGDGTISNIPYKYGGHDIWFCRKLLEQNIEMGVVPNMEANHLRCKELQRIEYNNGSYHIEALPLSKGET